MTMARVLTIGQFLDYKPFALEPVTRDLSLDAPISGAHVVEMPEPGPWLDRGYLALTTGAALKGSSERQRAFVASVHEAGAAGLCFGIGVTFRAVPAAIVNAGREVGLPIIAVPWHVPFREILSFVTRSTLIEGFLDFKRLVGFQDYLMGALGHADCEASLAIRLQQLLGESMTIFHPDGRVAAAGAPAPQRELWAIVRGERPAPAGRRCLVVEAEIDGDAAYVLTTCVRDDDRTAAVAQEILRCGAHVAQAIAVAQRARVERDLAERRALIGDLLSRRGDVACLDERLRALSLDGPLGVLVARRYGEAGDGESLTALRAVEAECRSLFDHLRVPSLCSSIADRALVVWSSLSVDYGDVVAGLLELAATANLAIGLAHRDNAPEHVAGAVRGASVALLAAEGLGRPGVMAYDDLALADVMLASSPPDLVGVAHATLEPLRRDHPDLMETLLAYIHHDCDVGACAHELVVHPNTIRYRLARIEEVLGQSLRSVATLSNLYLAVRLEGAALDRIAPPGLVPAGS